MRRSKIVSPLHFVFATRARVPRITPAVERDVHRLLSQQARALGCEVLAVGGLPDHVHIAVLFPATITYAAFIKQCKGATSRLLKEICPQQEDFYWQQGYGVFGFARPDIKRVVDYIATQKERHERNDLWNALEETDEPSPVVAAIEPSPVVPAVCRGVVCVAGRFVPAIEIAE